MTVTVTVRRCCEPPKTMPKPTGHNLAVLSEGVGGSGCNLLPKSPRTHAVLVVLNLETPLLASSARAGS